MTAGRRRVDNGLGRRKAPRLVARLERVIFAALCGFAALWAVLCAYLLVWG